MVELIDPSVFKNLPQVTSTISFGPNGPTNDGLYSKIIFGDSLQANTFNFAYINLGTKIMNPELYLNISKIDPLLKKLIDPSTPTIKGQLQNGVIIPSENGKRGLGWLYSVWDQIDFKKYTKYSKLLKDNIIDMSKITKEMAFLDKWLVIPPIYRPYVEDKKRPGLYVEDEITGMYKSIIQAAGSQKGENSFMDKLLDASSKVDIIQARVNKLHIHIINIVGKTAGAQEQRLFGKRQNNVCRLVANADPRIPVDCVATPWFALLGLFDMTVIATIIHSERKEEIFKTLEFPENTTPEDWGRFFDFVYRNVDVFVGTEAGKKKKKLLIEILEEMFEKLPELRILLKRDPAWTKESFGGLKPVINTTESYVYIVNSQIYVPFGGDSFNTKITGIYINKQNLLKKNIRKMEYSIDLPNKDKVFILKSLDYFLDDK